MKIFSLSDEKAEKILKSQRMTLKKNADESTAKKLGSTLKKAGLDIAFTKSALKETIQETASPQPPEAESKGVPPSAEKPKLKEPESPLAATAAKAAQVPFEFHGKGSEYFKIWLVNIILTIITLGIYSPWAKVRRKQYFYGSTRLKGAGFEYLADPAKILKGRLIVVGFIAINSLVTEFVPTIGFVFGLIFLVVFPWLVVRSLAFNARNSSLRNIRFGFDGSVKDAAKVYVLWPFLATLTLGILFPYVFYLQKKFIVENSSYGTTKLKFVATARDYYRIFFGALIPIIIGLGIPAATYLFYPDMAILVGSVIVPVVYLYLFAYFSVQTTNLLYNSSSLGQHHLDAALKIKGYMGLVVTNSLATAFTLGLFHPWAKVRTARYKAEHLNLLAAGDLDSFVAKEQEQISALGEEAADFFDIDFGL
jgi:uncharacterized membrane protein YjgN (DUF898 family)